MISRQQKYINDHDLHGDDFEKIFDIDENEKQDDSDSDEISNLKSHDHKSAHSQKP